MSRGFRYSGISQGHRHPIAHVFRFLVRLQSQLGYPFINTKEMSTNFCQGSDHLLLWDPTERSLVARRTPVLLFQRNQRGAHKPDAEGRVSA